MKTKTYLNPPVAIPIEENELVSFGIPKEAIQEGEFRGELKTYGPWQIPDSFRALCVSSEWKDSKVSSVSIHGMRKMFNLKQSGYSLDGWVSVNGEKYSAFTSSQLFGLPGGKLVNVTVIHTRKKSQKRG